MRIAPFAKHIVHIRGPANEHYNIKAALDWTGHTKSADIFTCLTFIWLRFEAPMKKSENILRISLLAHLTMARRKCINIRWSRSQSISAQANMFSQDTNLGWGSEVDENVISAGCHDTSYLRKFSKFMFILDFSIALYKQQVHLHAGRVQYRHSPTVVSSTV